MKDFLKHIMNWMARPFPHINAIVLSVFACLIFLAGVAIAWHPYITEVLDILNAPKLRVAIRVFAFLFLSIYCTLGCLCRILIQFFPEDFAEGTGNL